MRFPKFNFEYFNSQLLRTLSYTYSGGADINECLETAEKIQDSDFDSWRNEWLLLADNTYQQGLRSLSDHCENSARSAFLRASNYYRTSFFFEYKAPISQKLIKGYEKHVDAFIQAVKQFKTPVETVRIPVENSYLEGYFYRPFNDFIARPTIIANSGYDSTHQELFHLVVAPALTREYNVFAFDGPGQGGALIQRHLYMRPDWDSVITPIIDYLRSRGDVIPNQIILIGISWGGCLGPLAATKEHRLAALVANPGQFNPIDRIRGLIPNIEELLETEQTEAINKKLEILLNDPALQFTFDAKMFVHGVTKPVSLIQEWQRYSLTGLAPLIKCPTLVIDSEREAFSKGQAKQLYDALVCKGKDYELLKGFAGEHCQSGALSAFEQAVFDWLKQNLPIASKERETIKG